MHDVSKRHLKNPHIKYVRTVHKFSIKIYLCFHLENYSIVLKIGNVIINLKK